MSGYHCGRCREQLQFDTTWLGDVIASCACDRLNRGLCLDCPRPRAGQRLRCAECHTHHFRRRHRSGCRRRYRTHRPDRLMYARDWYRANRRRIVAQRHAKRLERRQAAA